MAEERSGKPGLRPDFATWIGVCLAVGGIIVGLLAEGGKITDLQGGSAALIVFGGTLGAVFVTTPWETLRRAAARLKWVFFDRVESTEAVIDEVIGYATKARKQGLVALEDDAEAVADPFLRKALQLAVDGADIQDLRKMMELEISVTEQYGEMEAKVFEAAGGYAPTIGIIGAVLGLIQVMKHIEDTKEVGSGIAVAFIATVYGVASANLFFLPAANKLRARLHRRTMLSELMLEGVVSIVEGLNPKLIRSKLQAYSRANVQKTKALSGKARAAETAPSQAGG
jgi:chemotaxis protein MotA